VGSKVRKSKCVDGKFPPEEYALAVYEVSEIIEDGNFSENPPFPFDTPLHLDGNGEPKPYEPPEFIFNMSMDPDINWTEIYESGNATPPVPPWRATHPYVGYSYEYDMPGLCALASFMFVVVGLRKSGSFEKSLLGLHEPLVYT